MTSDLPAEPSPPPPFAPARPVPSQFQPAETASTRQTSQPEPWAPDAQSRHPVSRAMAGTTTRIDLGHPQPAVGAPRQTPPAIPAPIDEGSPGHPSRAATALPRDAADPAHGAVVAARAESGTARSPAEAVVPGAVVAGKDSAIPIVPAIAAFSSMAAARPRDATRVTIGRVEVQVNNLSPQAPTVTEFKRVSALRPVSGLFPESHDLDRFCLRP
jgi:hypothetical protein